MDACMHGELLWNVGWMYDWNATVFTDVLCGDAVFI